MSQLHGSIITKTSSSTMVRGGIRARNRIREVLLPLRLHKQGVSYVIFPPRSRAQAKWQTFLIFNFI